MCNYYCQATTGSVFIINANGDREDITDALGARPRRGGGFSAQSTLAALRRYISGHTGQAIAANEPAVEDFDDDETESFSWGRYRGRATATGLFPKTVQPIREGVELERRGLFGKVRAASLLVMGGEYSMLRGTAGEAARHAQSA